GPIPGQTQARLPLQPGHIPHELFRRAAPSNASSPTCKTHQTESRKENRAKENIGGISSMKKLIAASAVILSATLSPALAADMPVKAKPLYSSDWTGFYLFGGGGY